MYEAADDDEVPAEADSAEPEQNHEEMPETEEPDDLPVDETVQRLEQKGIGSRMKLEDALQSLLRPKKEEQEAEAEEELEEEDIPELEAAIEEIESVIDLELVNKYAVKRKREIHFDLWRRNFPAI